MCGRAYSVLKANDLEEEYGIKLPVKFPKLKPNYNIAPSTHLPVVWSPGDQLKPQLGLLKWGLIPFWAKDEKIGYKMINARSETITEKPSFKHAFKKRRCIVPVSGFYEWKRDKKAKRPFKIFLKENSLMSLAGIWEKWTHPDASEVYSFSLITTAENSLMKSIHDRMPVILNSDQYDAWLDPKNQSTDSLIKWLKPFASKPMEAIEISTKVNSPRNNDQSLLDPLS